MAIAIVATLAAMRFPVVAQVCHALPAKHGDKAAEAESTPQEIAWAAFPDRERRAPMQFAPFP